MMVVTVKVAVEPLAVAVKTALTVNMILPHMDLNAVIPHGMSMVLIVPHWKVVTTGIAQAVIVLVILVAVMVVVNAQMVI
jgi:hypothetical protein